MVENEKPEEEEKLPEDTKGIIRRTNHTKNPTNIFAVGKFRPSLPGEGWEADRRRSVVVHHHLQDGVGEWIRFAKKWVLNREEPHRPSIGNIKSPQGVLLVLRHLRPHRPRPDEEDHQEHSQTIRSPDGSRVGVHPLLIVVVSTVEVFAVGSTSTTPVVLGTSSTVHRRVPPEVVHWSVEVEVPRGFLYQRGGKTSE